MSAWRSAKQERSYLVTVMRAEGKTWVQIAEDFRERCGVNARKAMRWAHGWSQDDVAAEWRRRWPDEPRTGQNISTWERWPVSGHEPSLGTLIRLAEIYECDVSDLVTDLGCFRHRDRIAASTVREPLIVGRERHLAPVVPITPEDSMDTSRRRFTAAAVVAALGMADPFRELLTQTETSGHFIGQEHVRQIETAVEQVERQDATFGGSDVLTTVDALHRQVSAWLQARSFGTPAVENALQRVRGDLLQWSGWLAFDADHLRRARRHTDEALVQARLIDDPVLEVQALNTLCQLLIAEGRPQESLQAAEAAQRIARGWATPRVATLFHLRTARAHAALGDQQPFRREIANAKFQMDQGPHEDDPLFVHFVTPQEVASIEGLSYLSMDRPDRATAAFHQATDNPDPARHRNLAYYTVWSAVGHAREHDLIGASEVGLAAIPLVADLTPGRTTRLLGQLRAHVEPHRRGAPEVQDFVHAYDEAQAQ